MAGSAISDSAPDLLIHPHDSETESLLAWPSAIHRTWGSSAARYTTLLETPLQCASGLMTRHSASSHRPGNQNPQLARKVPQAPRPAGYDPGEMCGSPGANSSIRPGTSARSSPPCHTAQPCG